MAQSNDSGTSLWPLVLGGAHFLQLYRKNKCSDPYNVEPRYNERPRDWLNLFPTTRSRYIEVLPPGGDLGGGCGGGAPPPPPSPWDELWFIGVRVEQEKSAPPPIKNPGSAPVTIYFSITGVKKIVRYTEDFVISRFHCILIHLSKIGRNLCAVFWQFHDHRGRKLYHALLGRGRQGETSI